MTSDEIRTLFLSFFEEKGHTILPSSSLIPKDDPTLLLTTAGMVQIKPFFLGQATPPNTRLATCQKCFRTTDIDSVGDYNHLTFFEMLGNFSVGDYFKKEAIVWGWEFVTERLKLAPERLWVSVFTDDDEAYEMWRKIGVPESRIVRFGEEDNFWGPAGTSGPCGPCSEIYYDFGEDVGCRRPECDPSCNCGRFSEIWNLVFTQYDQAEDGTRTLLPRPNIDTGMGLERTTVIMQGKNSVYETDIFMPLLEKVAELTGKEYGKDETIDRAMRIIAEHSRGIAFLIADGVMPSNEGRGYVLRRLLRRTAMFGRSLGLDKPFLTAISDLSIQRMGHTYPELTQRRDFILKVINSEETRFNETLNTGLELLDSMIAGVTGNGNRTITGEQAFKLYDTYGFPVELTTEVASSRGLSVDIEGFHREMEAQRERARAARSFDHGEKVIDGNGDSPWGDIEVEFVGYDTLFCNAVVKAVVVDGIAAERVEEGQQAELVLQSTPFYGEMGGQVGDRGEIRSETGTFTVTDTIHAGQKTVVHRGTVTAGYLSVSDEVEAEVDRERRNDIARNHTATHLLHMALREVLGTHVEQRGSVVAPERLRFDFSHLTSMLPEELEQINRIVNDKIRQNLPVTTSEKSYHEAVKSGAMALFDEKYGDVVRVLSIGEPAVSTELCGGTHVKATGEIGFFQVLSESSVGAGLRRIEAVTGRASETLIDKRFKTLGEIAGMLESDIDDTASKVNEYLETLRQEKRKRQALEREVALARAAALVGAVEKINDVNLVTSLVPDTRVETLREMADYIRDKLGSVIIVFGTVIEKRPIFLAVVTDDLVKKGYNAGSIVKEVARVTGGGGGGRPNMAQAGGKDAGKVQQALDTVKKLV